MGLGVHLRASARCLCSAGCQTSSPSSALAPWAAAEPCCHPWGDLPCFWHPSRLSTRGHCLGLSMQGCHAGFWAQGCHLGLSTPKHPSGQFPLAMLGSGPAPGGLCLLSEVVLTFRLCQVFGLVFMALSGFPLPPLAVCSLPWE